MGDRMARAWATAFYNTKAWHDCRDAYAKSVGGLCEECLRHGLIKAGEIVHHKVPLTQDNINDPDVALSWDNLELLCRDCHAKAHGSTKRYKVDAFGHIVIK